MYDSRILNQWDQTAAILQHLHSLIMIVNNSLQKHKIHPLSFYDLHPFRESKQKQGVRINTRNFSVLREIGSLMSRK